MPGPAAHRHSIIFIFCTVLIDAIGIGIIVPITPDLLRELGSFSLSEAALWGGYLGFSYALMQFMFGPVLGNLSDRFGRRPIILFSLGALSLDYIIMGLAPSLWLLFIGRILAGIAGATHSTANAYMADISPPEKRAQNFGLLGAAFGLGFIIGPLIGGLIGDLGTRLPFFVAAALGILNLLYGLWVMPESLSKEKRRPFHVARANPLGVVRQIQKVPMVAWFFVTLFLFDIAQFTYPAVWSFYAKEAFKWSNSQIGLSLAAVGICFAIVQGGLIRFFLAKFGEAATTILGLTFNFFGLVGLAFATQLWVVYALIPLAALGAMVTPALGALMSNATPDNAQGELQGGMTSVTAITLIISPLLMTQLFGAYTKADTTLYFPGAPFLAAAILTIFALIPFMIGLRKVGSGNKS